MGELQKSSDGTTWEVIGERSYYDHTSSRHRRAVEYRIAILFAPTAQAEVDNAVASLQAQVDFTYTPTLAGLPVATIKPSQVISVTITAPTPTAQPTSDGGVEDSAMHTSASVAVLAAAAAVAALL